jgi:hypothetical protein
VAWYPDAHMGGTRSCAVLALLLAACSASEDDVVDASEDALSASAKVEIKVMLAEVEDAPALLGAKESDLELRVVRFYDTSDLALFAKGVILRTRDKDGSDDDVTVKLRPLSAAKVAPTLLDQDGFKCEYDKSVGSRAVSSCSYTVDRELANAKDGLSGLFTNAQLDWLASHGTSPEWSRVRALGPINAEVWEYEPDGLEGEKLTLERWSVPGGARTIEASIKVKGNVATKAQNMLVTWLAAKGVHPAATQGAKTKAALEALTKPQATAN